MKLFKQLLAALLLSSAVVGAPGDITGLIQKNGANNPVPKTITGVAAGESLMPDSAKDLKSVSNGLLNVQLWGALGDGVTSDKAAIESAAAAAAALGSGIYFPKASGYAVSSGVTIPINCDVIMDDHILYTGAANEAALTIGTNTTANDNFRRRFRLDVLRSTVSDWTNDASKGILIYSANACDIDIVRSSGFTVGLECRGGLTDGFVFNNVRLGRLTNNRYGVRLTNSTNGWCNSNSFYGGSISEDSGMEATLTRIGIHITSDSAYVNNGNVFYNPAIELINTGTVGVCTAVWVESGQQNMVWGARDESNDIFLTETAPSTLNTAYSYIDYGANGTGTLVRKTGADIRPALIGIGTAPSATFPLRVFVSSDAAVVADVINTNVGTSASARHQVQSDAGSGYFEIRSLAHTTFPGKTLLVAPAGGTGANITTGGAGDPIGFWPNNTKVFEVADGAAAVTGNLTVSGTITGSGLGDVTAAAAFAVDNVLVRSDGTGKGVQASGVTVSDIDDVRANSFNVGTAASAGFPFRALLSANAATVHDIQNLDVGAVASARFQTKSDAGSGYLEMRSLAFSAFPGKMVISSPATASGTIITTGGAGDPIELWTNSTQRLEVTDAGATLTGDLVVSGAISGDGANVTNVAASNISGIFGDIEMTGDFIRQGLMTLTPNPLTNDASIEVFGMANNVLTSNSNETFVAPTATPADWSAFGLFLLPDTVDRTHTIFSVHSFSQGTAITSFTQKANLPVSLVFMRIPGSYVVWGVPLYTTDLPTATPDTANDYFPFADVSTGLESKALLSTIAGAAASDVAYDITTWDAVTTIPPSKNALRDYFTLGDSDGDGLANTLDTGAVLGTPASGTLTNATGLPAAGVVGTAAILGANTFTGAQTNSTSGAASAPAVLWSGAPYAAGSATTNFPLVYINEAAATASTTLSTGGTSFGINKDAASGDLMNLMQDGVSKFRVANSGNIQNGTLGGFELWTGAAGAGTRTGLFYDNNGARMELGSAGQISFSSTTGVGSADTLLTRDGAASLQMGIDSATPIAQTLKGTDSRAGTDTNTAGNSLTIASGRGTGTAATTATVVNIQTPTAVGSGTGAQTLATRLSVGTAGTVFGVGGTAVTTIISAAAAIDFASMLSMTEDTKTITVTGVATTNTPSIALGWSASLEAGITVQQAWVSGADTVTIRVRNNTVGTVDPASLTVRATVTSF